MKFWFTKDENEYKTINAIFRMHEISRGDDGFIVYNISNLKKDLVALLKRRN